MVPTPVPEPLAIAALATNAKSAWDSLANVLGWFTKVVTTSYAYSDLLVKSRQDKVNSSYKTKKANDEAAKIMAAQEQRENGVS